jgi:hypothetical protein
MTPEEAVGQVAQSTAAAGMDTSWTTLLDTQTLVARTSQFRWRWFATRLHTFVVAAPFPTDTATPDRLDRFLEAATAYAKDNKGGLPRGLQTGVAVIVVAVAGSAEPPAYQWAAAPHGRKFAALPFPVLVDTSTEQVVRPRRMLLGGVYLSHLKSVVDRHVAGPLRCRVVEP